MVSTRFVLVIIVWSYQCLPSFLMRPFGIHWHWTVWSCDDPLSIHLKHSRPKYSQCISVLISTGPTANTHCCSSQSHCLLWDLLAKSIREYDSKFVVCTKEKDLADLCNCLMSEIVCLALVQNLLACKGVGIAIDLHCCPSHYEGTHPHREASQPRMQHTPCDMLVSTLFAH